jgi:hypothetical protein
MPGSGHNGKSCPTISARATAHAGWLLTILMTAGLRAQTCPALPEGTICEHYHYHVLVWQPYERTYQEVAATRQFVTREACEKSRADAAKESQSIADYMKTSKTDSSMQADRFGDCHCDRTMEPSSGVFLDAKARMSQLRTEQESAWVIRERLLASELPTAGEYIRLLFGREPRLDRVFRETVPARLPENTARPAAAVLLETKIGAQSETPPVAANLSLIEIPPPGGGAALPPSAAATTPPASAGSTLATAESQREPSSDFFVYELARANAILSDSETISDPDIKNAVHQEVARRKRVLDNLRIIVRLSDPNSVTVRTLRGATDEASRLAVVRALFGAEVAPAWAPADARGAAATSALAADANPALVFDAAGNVAARRATLYGVLGLEHRLSPEEAASFTRVVEELLGK